MQLQPGLGACLALLATSACFAVERVDTCRTDGDCRTGATCVKTNGGGLECRQRCDTTPQCPRPLGCVQLSCQPVAQSCSNLSFCPDSFYCGPHNNQCIRLPQDQDSCTDRVQSGSEEGIDCGGLSCPPCSGSPCTELGNQLSCALGGTRTCSGGFWSACNDGACVPQTSTCLDGDVFRCDSKGQYIQVDDCNGLACNAATCTICTPGTQTCGAFNEVLTCNAAGTALERELCGNGGCAAICINGACVAGSAPVGSSCKGLDADFCNSACDANGACIAATPTCDDNNSCTTTECLPAMGCSTVLTVTGSVCTVKGSCGGCSSASLCSDELQEGC